MPKTGFTPSKSFDLGRFPPYKIYVFFVTNFDPKKEKEKEKHGKRKKKKARSTQGGPGRPREAQRGPGEGEGVDEPPSGKSVQGLKVHKIMCVSGLRFKVQEAFVCVSSTWVDYFPPPSSPFTLRSKKRKEKKKKRKKKIQKGRVPKPGYDHPKSFELDRSPPPPEKKGKRKEKERKKRREGGWRVTRNPFGLKLVIQQVLTRALFSEHRVRDGCIPTCSLVTLTTK